MVGNVTRRDQTQEHFRKLQNDISSSIGAIDGGKSFREDTWSYTAGAMRSDRTGGGITRVLEHGTIFEKAGVNFSAVESLLTKKLAARMEIEPQTIFATGISLVLHPHNPMIPAIHMNLRYLELQNGDAWFGGGTDLTPSYMYAEDIKQFHTSLKDLCDRYDPAWYAEFKKNCDEYFYLKHRNETRGVGGIFFDYQRREPGMMFEFIKDLGNHFIDIYRPIVERRKQEPWGDMEKQWQEVRRGRYVEFNLMYDRGTLFGIETEGRTESILMSLPPVARWGYDLRPKPGSRESELLEILHHPRSWV